MSAASPGAPTEESGSRSSGPGHLLRAARESAGIGVRDVAAQLRLDERLVSALENDDFNGLPAPTFVRGYLRGYARLLGVPVGPVMEAYDREGFTPPDLVADIAEPPDASTRDFPVRLASIGVVAALVVLVVLWWNNQAFNELPAPVPEPGATSGIVEPLAPGVSSTGSDGDRSATMQGRVGSRDESGGDPVPTPPSSVASAPEPAPSPPAGSPPAESLPGTARDFAAPRTAPAVTPRSREDNADRVIARAENVLERTRNEVNAIVGSAGPSPSNATSSTEAPGPTAATPPTTDSAPATATPSQTAAGSAQSPSGEARLVMRFPIEAWVEVYDRNNERMYYNLAKPGGVVDVTGEPPIRILLGRTRGVTVSFNGADVDVAPFTERGVARLTLGQ